MEFDQNKIRQIRKFCNKIFFFSSRIHTKNTNFSLFFTVYTLKITAI